GGPAPRPGPRQPPPGDRPPEDRGGGSRLRPRRGGHLHRPLLPERGRGRPEDRLLDPARANLLLAIGRRKTGEGAVAYGLAA
ncbi:hypothetical protein CTI14_67635, partial [Methylobacterium radiotolerans]